MHRYLLSRLLRLAARFLIPRSHPVRRRPTPAAHRRPVPLAHSRRVLLAVAAATAVSSSAWGATIYVDSRTGSDALDGLTAERVSDASGPVRTLRRATQLARRGDLIHLANNGVPYSGGCSLYGVFQSGSPNYPLTILGNGCTLSGAKPIDPRAWQMESDNVWRITPQRKGWYQLVLAGEAVPEVQPPENATSPPVLAPGTWCALEGVVYYRPPVGQDPPDLPLELADEQTGLTLLGVENVVIRDLQVRHFRQDGIHLHDRCRNVLLENVACEQNGRCGIVVGGTSSALLNRVSCTGNREASLLVEELGVADAASSTFDIRPVVRQSP
jgi:hypothetical protein